MHKVPFEVVLVLHNLRSAYNVGSIFRTADAAGVSKIFLVGTTPTPIDRFGRVQKEIAKTALGAEKTVPWEHMRTLAGTLGILTHRGVSVIAVEQARGALDYKRFHLKGPTAFVFGNEVKGLSPVARQHADRTIYIPMRGRKESLNVSVAAGIVLFRVLSV